MNTLKRIILSVGAGMLTAMASVLVLWAFVAIALWGSRVPDHSPIWLNALSIVAIGAGFAGALTAVVGACFLTLLASGSVWIGFEP